jgi:hypothetical protein
MHAKQLLTVLAAFVLTVAVQGTLAEAAPPVNLAFEKELVDEGVWEGTVSGDITGDLTTVLVDAVEAGPILLVTFDWIIDADDPDESFTARLDGILNTMTGSVVMNGTVTEGHMLGSRVQERGQLVDPDTLGFEGLFRIMPET